MTRAPASITRSTSAPSREKSAERIDGATRGEAISSAMRSLIGAEPTERVRTWLSRSKHRGAAGLALHVLGVAHAGDRLVFAAVRALRDQFEAAEAVDAAQPPGQLRRAQPGL